MEGNVNFFESRKMKKVFFYGFGLLLHPRAYGEYFVKPGVGKDEWRRDWVECGGWSNGQFSGGAPPGSNTNEILAAWRKKAKELDDCMQSKGYEHLEGYEYGKPKSK
jgi:hypothetical protein